MTEFCGKVKGIGDRELPVVLVAIFAGNWLR